MASKKKKKEDEIPILRVRKGATLREIYAQARKEFTAADLQKYTEIEEGVPFEQVIAECDRIYDEFMEKKQRRKRAR